MGVRGPPYHPSMGSIPYALYCIVVGSFAHRQVQLAQPIRRGRQRAVLDSPPEPGVQKANVSLSPLPSPFIPINSHLETILNSVLDAANFVRAGRPLPFPGLRNSLCTIATISELPASRCHASAAGARNTRQLRVGWHMGFRQADVFVHDTHA